MDKNMIRNEIGMKIGQTEVERMENKPHGPKQSLVAGVTHESDSALVVH